MELHQTIVKWLRTTDIPIKTISDKTNISRNTLHNWINGKPTRSRNIEKLYTVFNSEIELYRSSLKINNRRVNVYESEEKATIDSIYVMELQKTTISSLKQQNQELKTALEQKQAESMHWDSLPYDVMATVRLSYQKLKISRVIEDITDLKPMSKALGYSLEELEKIWCVGSKYIDFREHPIETIVDEETRKQIIEDSKTLPIVFNSLKRLIGHHYIPFPIIYIAKNGQKVPSITYNKIEWLSKTVYSKIKFLNTSN